MADNPTASSTGSRSIDIYGIFIASLQYVWLHHDYIARLAVLPLGMSFLSRVVRDVLQEADGSPTIPVLCITLLAIIPFTMFTVACHRLILLEEQTGPWAPFARWSIRETRFLCWVICIYLLAFLAAGIISPIMFLLSLLLGWFGGLVGGIVGYGEQGWALMGYLLLPLIAMIYTYVVGRMSLILPATAVDLRHSLGSIWALSERNDLRLMVLVGLLPTVSLATGAFVEDVLFAGDRSWLLLALFSLLEYMIAPVEIAILSLAFRELLSAAPTKSIRFQTALL